MKNALNFAFISFLSCLLACIYTNDQVEEQKSNSEISVRTIVTRSQYFEAYGMVFPAGTMIEGISDS